MRNNIYILSIQTVMNMDTVVIALKSGGVPHEYNFNTSTAQVAM